jgi:ATP-binding cassette subfamily F protein uup
VLDQVTQRIVEVDRGEAKSYAGNYAYYLARKAEQEASAQASEAKFKGALRRELEWLSKGPKARSTKQKARIQRIEAMREAPKRQVKGNLSLASNQRRLGRRAIEAEELAFWASDEARACGQAPLLQGFSYDFSPEDRVGMVLYQDSFFPTSMGFTPFSYLSSDYSTIRGQWRSSQAKASACRWRKRRF